MSSYEHHIQSTYFCFIALSTNSFFQEELSRSLSRFKNNRPISRVAVSFPALVNFVLALINYFSALMKHRRLPVYQTCTEQLCVTVSYQRQRRLLVCKPPLVIRTGITLSAQFPCQQAVSNVGEHEVGMK